MSKLKLKGKIIAGKNTIAIQKALMELGYEWCGANNRLEPRAWSIYIADGLMSLSVVSEQEVFNRQEGPLILSTPVTTYTFKEVPRTLHVLEGRYTREELIELLGDYDEKA